MHRIIFISLLLAAAGASAQGPYDRAQTWEYSLSTTHVGGWDSAGQGGSSLEVSSDTGWGVSASYNFTNRLAIQFGFTNLSPSYRATYVSEDGGTSETLEYTASLDTFHIGGTFYILPGRLTPFIAASAGWTTFDSNVISGPPLTGCWWDPWWGFRCARLYPTYGAREVSYTGTFGVRWDITSTLLLRAEYGMTAFEGNGLRDPEKPNMARVSFGWKF